MSGQARVDGAEGEGNPRDSARSSGLGSLCASLITLLPADWCQGGMRLPRHLPQGTQWLLVCHPPSPATAPQGHLKPGTGLKSLCSPQPH